MGLALPNTNFRVVDMFRHFVCSQFVARQFYTMCWDVRQLSSRAESGAAKFRAVTFSISSAHVKKEDVRRSRVEYPRFHLEPSAKWIGIRWASLYGMSIR